MQEDRQKRFTAYTEDDAQYCSNSFRGARKLIQFFCNLGECELSQGVLCQHSRNTDSRKYQQ